MYYKRAIGADHGIDHLGRGAGLDARCRCKVHFQALRKVWEQQVAVVNHSWGQWQRRRQGGIGGHPKWLYVYTPVLSTFVALPTVAPTLPEKLPRDFLPIGFVAENPMFVAENPALGVSTLSQLIALAKKRAAKLIQ